jgi:oligo-1,6-glucosidase/alpha-glucosidase
MVMNHTSDQHPWFLESSSSRSNAKADWYIWRNKPNNWKSMTGGSGWHYCKERDQYYWASFLPFQPDLNYRNTEVKNEMLNTVRFWLQKGVDGFRLDIFNVIYKDSLFRDNPFKLKALPDESDPSGFFQEAKYTMNQPESMEFAKQLRHVCQEFGDKLLIGEVSGNRQTIRKFSGADKNDGLGLVFDFEMLPFKFNAPYFKQLISNLEKDFPNPFMPVYVFSNHDRSRSMARLKNDMRKAKLLQLLQLTVRGVPCIYNGEELGMTNGHLAYSSALDPIGRKYKAVPHFISDLTGETLNRDEVRTPMQWNESANAGFSTASKTWLPVNADYKHVNVNTESNNDCSLLYQLRELLNLRKNIASLSQGSLEILPDANLPDGILAYKRKLGDREILVLLNFSKSKKEIQMPGHWQKVFSINREDGIENSKLLLNAYSGVILQMQSIQQN